MKLSDLESDDESARRAREEIRDRVRNRMGTPIPARELRPGDGTLEGRVTKVTLRDKKVVYTLDGLTKRKAKPDELVRVYRWARGVWARERQGE